MSNSDAVLLSSLLIILQVNTATAGKKRERRIIHHVIPVYVVSLKVRFLVLYYLACTPLSVLLFHHSPWTTTFMLTTHNFSSLSIHPFSTPASLSFSILCNRYLPGWLPICMLTLNSSKTEFLFIGLPQQLNKIASHVVGLRANCSTHEVLSLDLVCGTVCLQTYDWRSNSGIQATTQNSSV